MKKIQIIFSCLVAVGFLVGGSNLAFATDAECTSAGGNCNNTASECSKSGGSIISGSQCEDTSYVCCKAGSSATTPPASQTKAPAATSASGDTIDFPNPIKASTMSEFLANVLSALLGVVAFISLIFIIIGAVMYMLSAGNEQAVERAKKTITAAVVGFAIAAAAPTFLKTVKDILGGASGTNADDIVNKAYTLKDIAINVLNFLLSVTGIVAIIGLIVGAIFYLTSYGDEERMEKGKKILVASVIGIIVAFSALVIVRQVAGLVAAQ
ncbi:MAG: pilin [Parcubacteria group bacterium]